MSVVLDSSAVLALMLGERGGERVRERLRGSLLCSVNLSEVAAKLLDRRYGEDIARLAIEGLAVGVIPLNEERAFSAGVLRSRYRRSGLSFADCACLALAAERGWPALTGDRLWAELDHGIPVEVFR